MAGGIALAARRLAAGLALFGAAAQAAPECTATVATPAAALFEWLTTASDPGSAAALRTALRALWPGFAGDVDCERDARDSAALPGLTRMALADGSWLLQAACAQGAYQGSGWAAQLWATPGAAPQAALLCWPTLAEAGAPPALEWQRRIVFWGDLSPWAADGSGSVDVEILNRFRALGDCGMRSRYRLDHGRVVVIGIAAALACPETPADPPTGPADWPARPLPAR